MSAVDLEVLGHTAQLEHAGHPTHRPTRPRSKRRATSSSTPIDGDHHEDGEDLVGLQESLRAHDPVAQPDRRGDQLGHHDEVPRRGGVDPDRIDDARQGVRHDDLAQYLAAAGAQRVGHVDQGGRHAADDVCGHERVEEHRADEQDGDLGWFVDAEPDDEQRDERARRKVPQQTDHGLERGLTGQERAHDDAERHRDQYREPEPEQHALHRGPQVGVQLTRSGHLQAGRQHGGRRGQERGGHHPGRGEGDQARNGTSIDSTVSVQRPRRGIGVADGQQRGGPAGLGPPWQRRPLGATGRAGGVALGRVGDAGTGHRRHHPGAALTNRPSNNPSSGGLLSARPELTRKSAMLLAWKLRLADVVPGVNASMFCCRVKIVVPVS